MSGGGSQPAPQPQQVSSTSSSEPPEFVKPFSEDLLRRATTLSENPFQPPLSSPGERLEPFSPEQELALQGITNRAIQGAPEVNAARGFLTNTINRDPTNNPLVDRLVGTAQGDIVDQFNLNVAPQFAAANRQSGSFGNTGLQELGAASRFSLARALGDVENQIRLPAFESSQNRALSAAQGAPQFANVDFTDLTALLGVGQERQSFGQAGRDIDFSNLLQARQDPIEQLGILSAAINAAQGGGAFGSRSQTGNQFFQPQRGVNPFLSALGAGGSFLGGVGTLIGAF